VRAALRWASTACTSRIAGNTLPAPRARASIYAVSADAGATWTKASGAAHPRPAASAARMARPTRATWWCARPRSPSSRRCAIDRDGRIAVQGDGTWRTWDGAAWTPIVPAAWASSVPMACSPARPARPSAALPALGQPAVAHRDRLRPGLLDERAGHDEHRMRSTPSACRQAPTSSMPRACRCSRRSFSTRRAIAPPAAPPAPAPNRRWAPARPSTATPASKWYTLSARARVAAVPPTRPAPGAYRHPLCPDQRQRPARARSPRLAAPGLAVDGDRPGTTLDAQQQGEAFSAVADRPGRFAIAQPKPWCAATGLAISRQPSGPSSAGTPARRARADRAGRPPSSPRPLRASPGPRATMGPCLAELDARWSVPAPTPSSAPRRRPGPTPSSPTGPDRDRRLGATPPACDGTMRTPTSSPASTPPASGRIRRP
jgi:hypothetical protein